MAHALETSNERVISGALALVMHGLFLALLVFSVSWKKEEPVPVVAELWNSLPPLAAPEPQPPPPQPRPAPEPPRPKVEPKPVPKPEPRKADIELREKQEKARKAKELALAEQKKREEQKRREAQERAEAERQAKEAAEAKRREQEQAEALKKLAQQQAAAQAREIEKYKQAIAAHIRKRIIEPANLQGNPRVELDVTVLPGGEVLSVRTRTPSGQPAWDNEVERAIMRAQPLPLPPPDSPVFRHFRELNLIFRPKE
jgi:colicin import membrane protein